MNNDALGSRMKQYESVNDSVIMPNTPFYARLDGRGFSKYTKDMERPYDHKMITCMTQTAWRLLEAFDAKIAYTQSDEISLVWMPDRDMMFDGRIQKLASSLAGYASVEFYKQALMYFPKKRQKTPTFDCRVCSLPTLTEAANMILWREMDATKNSVSMATRHYYSHKSLHGKRRAEMMDLLMERGVNWNDYPDHFKRGTYITKSVVKSKFTADEIEKLPPRHNARKNPDLEFERNVVSTTNFPPLSKVEDRVKLLFGDGDDQR